MPVIVIRQKYADVADELAAFLEQNGVTLTKQSRALLRLAAQGWFEEPPEFVPGEGAGEERLRSWFNQIVGEAKHERHVEARRESGEPVPFTDLFYALAESGRYVLRETVLKGFGAE